LIDFNEYETVKLSDVAEYGRAKQGKVYPHGTSTLQISAARGQIGYLDYPDEVHTKNVAIIPQAGIDPKYFNIVMQKNIDEFMRVYATGLNIQEKEVGNFPIDLHNYETQKAVVKMTNYLDWKETQASDELNVLLEMKRTLLNKMMI